MNRKTAGSILLICVILSALRQSYNNNLYISWILLAIPLIAIMLIYFLKNKTATPVRFSKLFLMQILANVLIINIALFYIPRNFLSNFSIIGAYILLNFLFIFLIVRRRISLN
jgi:hypothetical protein